ncbi:MAG: SRPBCC family protein [Methylovirgula sp.]
MIDLHWEADIRASAERVFWLLAELRDYDRWLPRSSAFRGTNNISDGPIAVGTTYIEPGPFGVRHGKVTEFAPPNRLCFEQPMTVKPEALGIIGIRLFHTLTPRLDTVHLRRELQLEPHGPVKFAMPLVVLAFRVENARMMKMLKAFAESAAD